MSETSESAVEDDTYTLKLLEMKSDALAKSELGNHTSSCRHQSLPHNGLSHGPNYPNNWRKGCRQSPSSKQTYESADDEQKLSLDLERQLEGVTIHQNLQALSSAQMNPDYNLPAVLKTSTKCCGNKVLVSVLGVLVVVIALSCFAAMTLAINNYTNEKDRFDQMEAQIKQLQAAYKDSEVHDNSLDTIFKINDTVSTLASHITHLQASLQSQTSASESVVTKMSDLETELRLANETHMNTQLELDSLNASSILMGTDVNLLFASLQSMQEEYQSKLVLVDTAVNSTKNMTDLLLTEILTLQGMAPAIVANICSLGNQLNTTRADLEALKNHITAIQAHSTRIVASFDTRLNMTTSAADLLTSYVSSMRTMLDSTSTQIISTTNAIASLRRNDTLTEQALHNTNSNLNAVQAEFGRISATFNRLNTTLNSNMRLYGACYKDNVNCTVYRHQTTPYWYRCTTAAIRSNTPVS